MSNELHKMVRNYNNDGAWSIFQSLVLYKNQGINIYDLGNHTRIKVAVSMGETKLKYGEGKFLIDNLDNAYVWIRHENTGSHSASHLSPTIVNIDKDDFRKRFGVQM